MLDIRVICDNFEVYDVGWCVRGFEFYVVKLNDLNN